MVLTGKELHIFESCGRMSGIKSVNLSLHVDRIIFFFDSRNENEKETMFCQKSSGMPWAKFEI